MLNVMRIFAYLKALPWNYIKTTLAGIKKSFILCFSQIRQCGVSKLVVVISCYDYDSKKVYENVFNLCLFSLTVHLKCVHDKEQ